MDKQSHVKGETETTALILADSQCQQNGTSTLVLSQLSRHHDGA
jgi:hypothetical protein